MTTPRRGQRGCSEVDMNPVFSQPWWLDAVAPGKWEEINVAPASGLSGRLIYMSKRRNGVFKSLVAPPLSPRLGPLLSYPSEGKNSKVISDQVTILEELIAAIPSHDIFGQNCVPEFNFWSPFKWAGYNQSTYYSYVLEDLTSEEALWKQLSQGHRRKITKAGEQYEIRDDLPPQVLVDLVTATFSRQGLDIFVDPQVLKRAAAVGVANESARQLVAVDKSGKPMAGCLMVWDEDRAYYLTGGRADSQGPDPMAFVLWEAIRLASKTSKKFDFEGSMIKGIDRFFRGFGGRPEPYSYLGRLSLRAEAARVLGNGVLTSQAAVRTKGRNL